MTRRTAAGLYVGSLLVLSAFGALWALALLAVCWGVALAVFPWRNA